MKTRKSKVLQLGDHIVSNSKICGGSPMIAGSRVPVRVIAGWWKMGLSLDEIMDGYPQLRPEQITSALTYYFEHQAEIEADIEANSEAKAKAKLRKEGLLS